MVAFGLASRSGLLDIAGLAEARQFGRLDHARLRDRPPLLARRTLDDRR
jgi:hypothetical protein